MTKPPPTEIPPFKIYRFEGLQQMLTRALHENRVREECLEVARKALKEIWWKNEYPYGRIAGDALVEIVARLAQLEPEEGTG